MKTKKTDLLIKDFSRPALISRGFNEKQTREIEAGLELGLNVSLYADTCFDADQMYQIRRGLEEGVDVIAYALPQYSFDMMNVVRNKLYMRKILTSI